MMHISSYNKNIEYIYNKSFLLLHKRMLPSTVREIEQIDQDYGQQNKNDTTGMNVKKRQNSLI